MLFELLTGVRPFVADDPMRVLEMHLKSPIPSLRVLRPDLGISPELEAAIVRALQKQPSDRFASAEEFDAALQGVPEIQRQHPPRHTPAAVTSEPAAAGPELEPALDPVATAEMFEPAPTVFAPRSRSPLWIVLGAILLLSGVAVALYLAGVFRR
jgi:serine/threonine-protein kinase